MNETRTNPFTPAYRALIAEANAAERAYDRKGVPFRGPEADRLDRACKALEAYEAANNI